MRRKHRKSVPSACACCAGGPSRSGTLDWAALRNGEADRGDGQIVEITGWMAPIECAAEHDYFLLVPEMACCIGCLPADPRSAVEIFAPSPIAAQSGPVTLNGRLCRLHDDPAGWLYQLRDATLIAVAEPAPSETAISRRVFIGGVGAATVAACTPAEPQASAAPVDTAVRSEAATQLLAATVSVDIHSHAGRIIRRTETFEPVATPMRDGGQSTICLAIVADSAVTKKMPDGRIKAIRTPEPGELYARGQESFKRALRLVKEQGLSIVTDPAGLAATRQGGPGAIIAAEGADFLERDPDRLDEAYAAYHLRHLQLTHYRVNDLGDIQTEAPVHYGLTDYGAEIIRRCNRLGIVVDVAHGTLDLVKRAAKITTRPLVLSHTSLRQRPTPRSRTIAPDHARIIAGTGGVIGIWPPSTIFRDLDAYARGIAEMADTIGVDHVGIGSDMLGLTSPSVYGDYRLLPKLAARLLANGFDSAGAAKILGGNYQRVFAVSMSS